VFVQVSLHEAAHALVSRLVGLSPFAVIVGKGPLLFRGRAWGLDLYLHALPLFGVVQLIPPPPGTRWQGAAYSISGLLVDTALLLLVLLVLAGQTWAFLFFAVLAIYQVMVILTNLVPMDVRVGAVRIPNDGKQFLGYVFKRRSIALDAYRDNVARYDPAFRIEDSWMMRADAPMLQLWSRAAIDIAAKRYADGIEKHLRLLGVAALHPAERAMYLDSLACVPLYQGEASLLNAAEQWSREAQALLPECRTIRGTRGAVLVESGRHAEGLALLMPLTTDDNGRIDRALSTCYVARALHGLGRTAEAREWLKSARQYDEFGSLVSRIASQMAARREEAA
jgi:hypothetical protein